ncbi:MAG: RNA pyrophosphohydrolase [Rhodomicrobium sp.]
MALVDPNTLPYRPCVGIVLFNAEGLIWIGRRSQDLVAQEIHARWQMPQGGIDGPEDPKAAALRELYEETAIRSVNVLGETQEWIYYDLPPEAVGKALGGKFRGQRQKWFAMRFTGQKDEINLEPPGHKPEFDAWRWAPPSEVLELIAGFKRSAYEAVLAELAHFAVQ